MRTQLYRCSLLAFTGGDQTKWRHSLFRSMNSKSCAVRAERPFPTSIYTSPTMSRKDGMFRHRGVKALVTLFLQFFYRAMGYGKWRPSCSSAIEPSRFGRSGCVVQNHFAGIRHSRRVCFMLSESMQENCFSPLTRFSNGRKRKLRPIHSLDQGDRTGHVAVNRLPRQFS